jgi:polyphosphate kinase
MKLDKPKHFLNRELSWLKFNIRVLQEAEDKTTPLLERLRYIAICGSNLDEFFMIRVAGLQNHLDNGINKTDAAGLTVHQQLTQITETTQSMVKTQYRYLKNILQDLEQHGVFFTSVDDLSASGKEWIEDYFHHTIFPVITPLAVDAGHPFPFLANRSLNLALLLQRESSDYSTAVVQVPGVLPRIVEIPGSARGRCFVFLEDIIRAHAANLFYGYSIKDIVPFRITRNADVFISEEEAEDLLMEVERSLRQRKRGEAVRLEIGKAKTKLLRSFLVDALEIEEQDIYNITGPIDTTCFMKFADLPGFEDLRHQPYIPQIAADLLGKGSLFDAISEKDILLHHPYESFEPVIDFVRRAANDPAVLAIKQTLYRVSGNSPIIQALAQAAENGKQVTVLVELKARFDEANNIVWARRLEKAGCHVIYGLVGLKTHAKMTLVVRNESRGIKRYVHMSTGNYNDATARLYTDIGLFTANDQFGADASAFFNVLSGYSDPPVWNKIVVAPLGLREKIHELIDREIQHALAGGPARIIVKMNSLLDKDIILKLYEASQKGVDIQLIIRGICVLIPGLAGVSERISVRSIVGRLLEHSRIFYFQNGGDEKIYLSSADWMPRNLNQRVELLFPVDDPDHIQRIKAILDLSLKDNQKSHIMRSDGTYRKVERKGKPVNSQLELMTLAQATAASLELPLVQRLQPIYRKEE